MINLEQPQGPTPPLTFAQRIRKNRRAIVITTLGAILLAAATWLWGGDLWRLLTDEQAIEGIVTRAGPWGPLALIAINVLQVVVAPIPGYVVQLAAGYLYGPLWGGIYAAIGIVVGAMTAMWVGRTFGRPAARLLVGEERLTRWESVTHSDSPWVWLLLILGPIGDLPYLLAGLSRVSYLSIFLITIFVRMPTAFLSTAIGGGAISFIWLGVLAAVAAVVMLIGYRYRAPIMAWYEQTIKQHGRRSVHADETTGVNADAAHLPDSTLQPIPVERRRDESWS